MPYTIKEIYRFVPRAERGRYSKDPAENSVLEYIRLLLEELEGVPDRSGSLKTDRMYLNNVLDAADGKLPEEKGDAAIRAVNTVIENIYKNQIDNRKLSGDKRERIKDLVGHIAAGLDLAPGLYPVTPAQRDAAKENREAGQRAVQEEITKRGYTDKWIKKHADSLKESERLYRAQGPLPEKRSEENPDGLSQNNYESMLKKSADNTLRYLRDIGVLESEKVAKVPEKDGMPRLFIVKDGKVSTLEESGIEYLTAPDKYGIPKPNPKLGEAAMRGELFTYPAGSRYPVQVQAAMRNNNANSIDVTNSAPLKPGLQKVELSPEPALAREPRWYHRAFKFWGNNRKICQEYDASVATHDKWQADTEKAVQNAMKGQPEAFRAADAIETRFGAKRTEAVMQEELRAAFSVYDARRKASNTKKAQAAEDKAASAKRGVDVAMEVFAADPIFRPEWEIKGDMGKGLYSKKDFNKLSHSKLDPKSLSVCGKPVSEKDFATLALFGSLQPDIAEKAQREAVADPEPMLSALQKKGFSEEMAKEILVSSVGQAYTSDVLHTENRMGQYFSTAMNGGREKAEMALTDYAAGKKDALAEILSRAVQFAGDNAGTHPSMKSGGDEGVHNMGVLADEMLNRYKDDPELMQLAGEKYEARDREFCEAMNKQVKKYAPKGKAPLKPRTFEETVQKIQEFKTYHEIEQKGLEAGAKLERANAEDRDLTADEKRQYIRDILKCNIVSEVFKRQLAERGYQNESELNQGNTLNASRVALRSFTNALEEEAKAAPGPQMGNAVNKGTGSSLPANAPSIIQSGLEGRFTEMPSMVRMVNTPSQMQQIEDRVEEIMQEDKLDQLDTEDLAETLRDGALQKNLYAGKNLILRMAKDPQAQKQAGSKEKPRELDTVLRQVSEPEAEDDLSL